MSAARIRDHFSFEPGLVFLNHGSYGARPRGVLEAQERIRREAEAEPVEFLARRSSDLLDGALARLGGYVHADPANLAFVTNATTAVAVAAASVGLGPGDEVLSTDHEYGACVMGWKRSCAKAGASWREVAVPLPWSGDEDFLARLEAAIGPRSRVLFLSHITSATALRFPVEKAVALAASKGILTVVDGAHAPGHLDLDLDALGADFYAGNCHKWLCAPLGSAFLHVRPQHHPAVEPLVASWGLVAEAEGGCAHDGYAGTSALSRRLRWLGTRDLSPFLAVPAAIDWSLRHDGEPERMRCAALADLTAREGARLFGLEAATRESQGLRMALLPLPPCDAAAVKASLFDRFRIEVPATSFGGESFLRLSFHAYNDKGDAEALLGALASLRLKD